MITSLGTYFRAKYINKYNYSFYFRTYRILTKLYSKITTLFENIFLKKLRSKSSFETSGIFHLDNKVKNIYLNQLLDAEELRLNKYSSMKVIKKELLYKVLLNIFDNQMRRSITNLTGFRYSIDYFKIYVNYHILEEDKISQRRDAHFDKPYSENMLKIFIPLDVDLESGPLKVHSKSYKRKFGKHKIDFNKNDHLLITGNGSEIYGVNANVCWHEETNPLKGKSCNVIMIQMSPATEWVYSLDLFEAQFKSEKKFTSLGSLFGKRRLLVEKNI